MNPNLKEQVKHFPLTPGVYIMRSEEDEILYIGKARMLKKRVMSYLTNKAHLPKVTALMEKVERVDYIETSTEVDALLLEARLVYENQPHYNIELKDDKSYPLLKITKEAYPRILITRNKSDKKAFYYGPFTDAKLLRQAVVLIHSLFPVRKCQKLPKTACLYYHIGQCLAPCIKPEIKPAYDKLVGEVRTFLGSGKRSLMEYLEDRMKEAAGEFRFEDAQFFKEQIEALGKLKKKRFSLKHPESGIGLAATLELKKYLGMDELPEKIVCFDVSNIQGDEAVASRVSFYRELPDKLAYRRYKIKTVSGINDYAMIQEALGRMLRGVKEGRETFIPDVIMIDGGKGHLAAAREILQKEGFEATKLISIAKRFETIYAFENAVIASDRRERSDLVSKQIASSALPPRNDKITDMEIPQKASALHLLQKIRDEAHRFAITYHRSLKEKNLRRSELDEIPGIGAKRKRVLLEQFDSLEEIKRTSAEQIAGLPGMGNEAARRVWEYFHP